VGRRILLVMVVVTLLSAACAGDDDDASGSGGRGDPGARPGPGGAVSTVHTIAGLEPVVRGLVEGYNQTAGAGVEVAVQPQSEAVRAVTQGTPAILPGPWLSGVNAESAVIGRNLAVIAVPAGNPAQVDGVDAFAEDSGLDTAVCGPNSPLGNFAALVLASGGVQPESELVKEGCEADAVARVSRGELDAALFFRSTVAIPENVEIVSIPDDRNIVVDIRYAPTTAGSDGNSFQAYLSSDQAKQILTQRGFLP